MAVLPRADFIILVSADIAALSPGTNTGAAQPVLAMGGELKGTMQQKDAAAPLRAATDKCAKNSEPAVKAILESESFPEDDALEASQIEVIGRDIHDLLAQLDGRTAIRFDGAEQTLHLAGEVANE